jgi:hypothetical protein
MLPSMVGVENDHGPRGRVDIGGEELHRVVREVIKANRLFAVEEGSTDGLGAIARTVGSTLKQSFARQKRSCSTSENPHAPRIARTE